MPIIVQAFPAIAYNFMPRASFACCHEDQAGNGSRRGRGAHRAYERGVKRSSRVIHVCLIAKFGRGVGSGQKPSSQCLDLPWPAILPTCHTPWREVPTATCGITGSSLPSKGEHDGVSANAGEAIGIMVLNFLNAMPGREDQSKEDGGQHRA